MKLEISTPEYHTFHEVGWLEINTPTGNYVIQIGHVPMILTLSAHKPLTFRLKTGKQESINVLHGIVKINRESATIIMVQAK